LNRHVFVVPFQTDDLRLVSQQRHQAGRVRSTVDHVAQANHAILWSETESVEKRSEGGQVAVNIAHHVEAMSVVKTRL
jgi:hypothetical protein